MTTATLPADAPVLDDLQLIDVDGLAQITGLSKPTLWRHHDAGLIPPGIKIGRSVRWRLRDVRAWIDDGCPARRSNHKE